MVNGSREAVGRELSINGSRETIGKRLGEIVRKMGFSLKDLNGSENNEATASALKRMIVEQDYRCALSGEKLTPETARLDHKVAVTNGGGNSIENLQWLDVEVNRMKGSLSQDSFIAICRKVVAWNN